MNAAFILESAAAIPAWDTKSRNAAQAMVAAYQNLVVVSSSGKAGDPRFDAAVDSANSRERALRELCGE